MSFVACGLNHKTAPISLREKLYFPKEKMVNSLSDLTRRASISEAVILSTCNRTEIYSTSPAKPECLINWLSDYHQLDAEMLSPYLYVHEGEDSIKHASRVASGIDSMVLGETQILGQLKDAVGFSEASGVLGSSLRRFFDHAFTVGKQIRTETDIGTNPVSLGFVITQVAKDFFEEVSNCRVLFIGAGEIATQINQYFALKGIKNISIATRANQLLSEINFKEVDIVIAATGSPVPLVLKKHMVSRDKPLLLFDLSVPRNIDPEIKNINHHYVYTMDDLKSMLDENSQKKSSAIQMAEDIIEVQSKQFIVKLKSLTVSHTVKKYRDKMTKIRDAFLEKSLKELAMGECPEKVLEKLASQLTNKFLHAPSVNLKKAACQDAWVLVHTAEKLLGIE